jgi:hypothetical protein
VFDTTELLVLLQAFRMVKRTVDDCEGHPHALRMVLSQCEEAGLEDLYASVSNLPGLSLADRERLEALHVDQRLLNP